MPLIPIPSQPIKLSPVEASVYNPSDFVEQDICPDCAEETAYCYKFTEFDFTSFQMYNEPVLADFSGNDCAFLTLDYEMGTKGDWEGAGWTNAGVDGDPLVHTPGSTDPLTLLNPPFTPVALQWYEVEIDVTILAGFVEFYWGAVHKFTFASIGTMSATFLCQAPDAIDMPNFIPDTTFDGSITGVRINRVNEGWENDNWTPDQEGCGYCITDSEIVDSVLIPSDVLQASTGLWYLLTFEIRNRTTGSVIVEPLTGSFATTDNLFASENGFYSIYFIPSNDTQFQWRALNGFDGCIYNIKLYTQCRNNKAYLFDSNDAIVVDLSAYLSYDFNWMTLDQINLSAFTLTDGECYHIGVASGCGDIVNLIRTDLAEWALSGSASLVDGNLFFQGSVDPGAAEYDYSGDDIDCTKCFIIRIHISEFTGAEGYISLTVGGTVLYTDAPITGTGWITVSGVDVECPLGDSKIIIAFRDADITIDSVTMSYDPACESGMSGMDFVSNCMAYLGNESIADPCLSVVQAGMDNQLAETVEPLEAFGFLWGVGFALAFREKFVFHASHHKGGENSYKYNNGNNKRTSAETEKLWDVAIGMVDENMHDVIALMNKMDWMMFSKTYQVVFGTATPPLSQLYQGTEDDYSGNWTKEAKTIKADGKFEVRRKLKSGRFSNNII